MKLYIDTLGCPKNTTDSEQLAGLFKSLGHTIVFTPDNADALIVNTCGFINDAKEESIDRILDLVAFKEAGALLIVTGCLSQRYGQELTKAIPEIDILLGVNDYESLPQILTDYKKGETKVLCNSAKTEYVEWGCRTSEKTSYSSYLKIAEGCNNICAYCVIPKIRGPYRSRKEDEVLKEAEALAKQGCKELILVAQDLTAYGMDLYGEYRLYALLEKLCKIDGIQWIRLMYCYEDRITDDLIRVIAKEEKICHYLDIPIQHASDKMLRAMNRRSTNASIRNTVKKLRKAIPDIHIRTTLITGFPGESK
ncbi:MAG: MiaB/RimO family radical SAM methylthiotransferase, partial [Eubacteriales bacterium]|nr:MiaB/RimO family radical SAM methylthiotransferase [Eubacteriales bacterium]